ncbi:hypothetical protein Q5427_10985 [Brochothrix thermosphacta]|uniref:hypothetical protein n=1 Tax=Brochothrix thermosphacta TaxID=2756 RepID=UPI002713779F|nr:hypothetical protein [Brochothrix thermosphacta]MDO7864813.1 hypothetical protein [Brochothrix thermosphacta]
MIKWFKKEVQQRKIKTFTTFEQFKELPEEKARKLEITNKYRNMDDNLFENPAEKYRALSTEIRKLIVVQEVEFEAIYNMRIENYYTKEILPLILERGVSITFKPDMILAYKYGIVHSDFPKLIDYLESLGFDVLNSKVWATDPVELLIY